MRYKKRYYFLLILIIALTINYTYRSYQKKIIKEDVKTYIKEGNFKAYNIDDVEEINSFYGGKTVGLQTGVIFDEEPYKKYYFRYDDEVIEPAGYSPLPHTD